MAEFVTAETLAAQAGLAHGFFTRRGGVSAGPFAALNCSVSSKDDPDAVRENRRRAADALGLPGAALAGTACGGMVRVAANDPALIGQALDAGAQGVIVPLIDRPEQAAAAVRACRFPPEGGRSYGPMRAGLRSGPRTAGMNAEIACVAMIETREGLDNLDAIAAVPGLDGLYVGPGDLMLALGGETITDPAHAETFEAALARIREAGRRAGIATGIHTGDGAVARRRLDEGFTFASISSDLNHLDQAARQHLATARQQPGQ